MVGGGDGETLCIMDCGDCGGWGPGQRGRGHGICGPRVPRIALDVPNMGDIGVERPVFIGEICGAGEFNERRGPDIIGGGEGAHGDGGL